MQVAIKVPLKGTLDHELQILRSLQGLGGVPSLAFDSLVEGAIVLTPVLQPLTLAAIWRGCLHLAVPALVSTFQVCVHKACCSVDPFVAMFMDALVPFEDCATLLQPVQCCCICKSNPLCDASLVLSLRRRTTLASSTEMCASAT